MNLLAETPLFTNSRQNEGASYQSHRREKRKSIQLDNTYINRKSYVRQHEMEKGSLKSEAIFLLCFFLEGGGAGWPLLFPVSVLDLYYWIQISILKSA